jgi:ATP-dependent Clp protease ATP-binding subunit ClpC
MSENPTMEMSDRAQAVLDAARNHAIGMWHEYVGTEHLLTGLCRCNPEIIRRVGLDPDLVADRIEESIRRGRGPIRLPHIFPFTTRAKDALSKSADDAVANGSSKIEPEHILAGLMQDRRSIATVVLESFGATDASQNSG